MTEPVAERGDGAIIEPVVDVRTERVAVVVQERPIVALTAWLADTARSCVQTKRGLQVVTASSARLTTPLWLLLHGQDTRWVVHDAEHGSYYDGTSGRPLAWDGSAYVVTQPPATAEPADDAAKFAPGFVRKSLAAGRQLIVNARIRHPDDDTVNLCGGTQALCELLGGGVPRGWGAAEPATQPWDSGALSAFVRQRLPQPTMLVVTGGGERAAIGMVRITRRPEGVEEAVTLAVGYPGEAPLERLGDVADSVVSRHEVLAMLVLLRPGWADLTHEPHLDGLPVPVGVAVGADGVDKMDTSQVPPEHQRWIGPPERRSMWLQPRAGQPQ